MLWTEPNYIYSAASSGNDPFLGSSGGWGQDFQDLWGLHQIDAPAAWEVTLGDGVLVAVVDSGVDVEHPDLAGRVWVNPGEIAANGADDDGNGFADDVHGWDFTRCDFTGSSGQCQEPKDRGPDVRDELGHGTHVAGIIAAGMDNGHGIVGVAPRAQLMIVKGLNKRGRGSSADLAEALMYAAENGAQVINASWTGPSSQVIRSAVEYAADVRDVTIVAAAGNDGRPLERGASPANLSSVVAVGAVTQHDEVATFSNFGGPLDLVAPGGGDSSAEGVVEPQHSILSLLARGSSFGRRCVSETECSVSPLVIGGGYVRTSGTSMAAAFASGVAALVKANTPRLSHQQVRQALIETADDLGQTGWDPASGYGRLNAARAVRATDIPVAQILSPGNRSKVWRRNLPANVRGTAATPGATMREWRLTLRWGDKPPREIGRGYESRFNEVLGVVSAAVGGDELAAGERHVLELQVEDEAGHIAHDTSVFLVPKQPFVPVPVPDPFDEGGQDLSISDDGQRILLTRVGRDDGNTPISLFTISSHDLDLIAEGSGAQLSPNGQVVVYKGSTMGTTWCELKDDHCQEFPKLLSAQRLRLNQDGTRIAFVQNSDLDPLGGNSDRSWEAFFLDLPPAEPRQITSWPSDRPFEVDQLALSRDGRRLAFTAPVDGSTAAIPLRMLYVYNDATQSTVTVVGSDLSVQSCEAPSVNRDGTLLTCRSRDLLLARSPTWELETLVEFVTFSGPVLSADGRRVAFGSQLDLDPSVGNEDLGPEVFMLDLESGRIEQVTDTINSVGVQADVAMDALGRTVVLGGVPQLNGTELRPSTVRFVRPSRASNGNPSWLDLPELAVAEVGQTAEIGLYAIDPDGDDITFLAERAGPVGQRLRDLARSTLIDHGGGRGVLRFAPRPGEGGRYPLRLAAFDDQGGLAVKELTIVIRGGCVADCNADETVTISELILAVRIALGQEDKTLCPTLDRNNDGAIGIDELVNAVATSLHGCDV